MTGVVLAGSALAWPLAVPAVVPGVTAYVVVDASVGIQRRFH
ncbi:hypothetical protein [Abyssibacter sp.]|nr:hypothetical protein [Abyssibacter sp.]